MGRKKLDPISEAAMDVVEMERRREELKLQEQAERERSIYQGAEIAGRIQALSMVGKLVTVTSLIQLQRAKDLKAYKDIPGVGTWEKYCDYLCVDRHTIDERLKQLGTFGEDFLVTATEMQVSFRDLRKLRQLTNEGTVQVTDTEVIIGDESIPLNVDHKEDLQAALERVIETNAKIIADKDATIRAKDKVLKDKQTLIERQARDLSKLEDAAAKVEMTPVEEAFIRKMENLRTSFDGYMLKVDPERCELATCGERTPRMNAAYLTTVDYMRKQLLVAFDVAQDLYGSAIMCPEDAWTQPEE